MRMIFSQFIWQTSTLTQMVVFALPDPYIIYMSCCFLVPTITIKISALIGIAFIWMDGARPR